ALLFLGRDLIRFCVPIHDDICPRWCRSKRGRHDAGEQQYAAPVLPCWLHGQTLQSALADKFCVLTEDDGSCSLRYLHPDESVRMQTEEIPLKGDRRTLLYGGRN